MIEAVILKKSGSEPSHPAGFFSSSIRSSTDTSAPVTGCRRKVCKGGKAEVTAEGRAEIVRLFGLWAAAFVAMRRLEGEEV